MRHFKRNTFTLVLLTILCLIFSSYLPAVNSETFSGFNLPCTINTYGNAWNGELSFDLEGNSSYMVVMDTNGTLVNLRESTGVNGYGPTYNIAPNTVLFEGEPVISDPGSAWPVWGTNIWNLTSNTTEPFPDVSSEHDIQYNPVNNTFLTLQDYIRQIGVNTILYDRIVEVNASGDVLWTWDTYNYIPLSEASPYNETFQVNGQTVEDFTHANSLDWDYNNNVIYLNLRNTNTFYKINQTTGNIIWACGEFGNFTLLGDNGQQVSSLWYGCHDLKEVAPDVFSLFNNDYANNTNPDDCHSSLMEITLNETSMTAYVNENWEAPTQYWNSYGGSNVILPNGDMLGDFGDPSHQLPQNEPWDFNNTGAVFVEVNSTGQMVKTFTFPVGWYVYRVQALTDTTSSANVSPTASTTPNNNSSPILSIIIGALAAVIVVIVVLTIVIYRRKMRVNLKNEVTIQKSGILLFTLQFSIN